MSMQSIVQLPGRWLAFDHDTVVVSDSRPRLEGSAWLFAEFDGGVSSVISLEGSPAHAVALIEKRLRADGMIDGEGKILIHKNRSMGAGYQTLFTAVPLEVWQQTYAWAEAQPDHCLVVPLTSLMWSAIKTGEGLVIHAGRQLCVLAVRKHDILCRSSMAYSEDASDLSMTAGALAQQIADDLARNDEDAEPMQFQWCSLFVPPVDPGQAPMNQILAEIFSANTGTRVKQVPMQTFTDPEGRSWSSGIHWVRAQASTRDAINPLPSRAAYLAEWALPFASAASLVLAIALGALGARWLLSANDADARSDVISTEIAVIEDQTRQLGGTAAVPAGFDAALQFLEKAKHLADGVNPVSGLEAVRRAAGDEVRILRVRVDQPATAPGTPPPLPGTAVQRTLRVDGMVDTDRGTPGMQIATFVERLRREGFDPIPLDPQSGGGTRAGGGVFSYLLKTVANGTTEPTP